MFYEFRFIDGSARVLVAHRPCTGPEPGDFSDLIFWLERTDFAWLHTTDETYRLVQNRMGDLTDATCPMVTSLKERFPRAQIDLDGTLVLHQDDRLLLKLAS